MRHVMMPVLFAVMLVGCNEASTAPPTPQMVTEAEVADPPPERFSQARIAEMEQSLRAEPKVVDLIHNDSAALVDWQIGVHSDGTSRIGYAGYVCQLLRAKGLVDDQTDVRIVDVDRLSRDEGNFRGASLGHMRCHDEATITP